MITKTFFIILIIFTSFSAYGIDTKFVVKYIHIKGLHRIEENTIISSLPIHINDIIHNENVNDIIRILFSTQNFDDIHVFHDNETLTVNVKERPVISKITFFGNKLIKDSVLKENLDSSGIRVGEFLNCAVLFHVKKSIVDFYHSIGKYNCILNIIITPLPHHLINLEFHFREGVSSKIQKINIIGNNAFKDNKLISNFQLHDKASRLNIINNRKFNRQKLEEDLKFLRNYYLDRGYVYFKIDSVQVNFTRDKRNIIINIKVTEGDQYKLACVLVNGNFLEYSKKIKKLAKIKSNELYSGKKVKQIISNIKQFLGENGYAYPNIRTSIKTNEKDKTIIIYLNIDVGNRFYVRRIHFEGNYISKDSVLRREILQMEGACFNIDLINQSIERLNRLGYFETVSTNIQKISDDSNQIDIFYKIKENNTGSFNFGVGYGTESGINFHSRIYQDNWVGNGYSIGFNSIKNSYQSYSEISINNPYFGINGISLGGRAFYTNFRANDADLSSYTNKSYGSDFNLGFLITKNISLQAGLGYIRNNLSKINPQVTMYRYLDSIGYNKNTINNSFKTSDFIFNYSLTYNKLNRGFFPTKGIYMNFDGKVTILKSDNNFYKVLFDSASYYPLDKDQKWIILGRTHFGYSNGLNGKETPFYENFYAGGSNTIRGFQFNNIGPKAVYCSNSSQKNINKSLFLTNKIYSSNDAIGGNAMVVTGLALITPTPFINEKYSNSVRTSFFVDIGTVLDTHWNKKKYPNITDYSDPKYFRISTGVAFQWMSPLGPLVFSYAQPLKKCNGDQIEKFQFYIGKTW